MAIARLTGQDATGTSATTSVSATYASTPTSGNVLIALVQHRSSASASTITGWTQPTNGFKVDSGNNAAITVFYKVSDGTESQTVTASRSAATGMSIAIFEYSGLAATPSDASATPTTGASVSTLPVGPTGILAQADELAIVAVGLANPFTSPSLTGGFSLRANISAASAGLISGDQITSATTPLSCTASWTTARNCSAVLVTFKSSSHGTTVLVLPGTSGNYGSAPDSAALSVTGDIDVRAKIAPDDWTPTAIQNVVSKWITTSNQRSYELQLRTDGTLFLQWSNDGTASLNATSTSATGFTDGTAHWVRATMDVDDGAGNRVVKFYTSDDGTTWTQLGTTVTTAGTTAIFDSTAGLELGSRIGGTTNLFAGNISRAQIRSNILDNGTGIVFDADFSTVTIVGTRNPSTMTESSSNAATVTLNGSAWNWGYGPATTGSAQALAGSTAATFGVAGALKVAHSLTGTTVLTTTATGTAKAAHPLAGSTGLVTSTAGTAKVAHSLAGTTALTFTVTGTAKTAHSLTGTTALTTGTTGTAKVTHSLTGTSALTTSTSGTAKAAHSLAASTSLTTSASGVAKVAHALTGTTTVTIGATGTLAGAAAVALTGTTGLTFTTAGTTRASRPLSGTTRLTTTCTGTARAARPLTGTTGCTFATTGTARCAHSLTGATRAAFTPSGHLTALLRLAGSTQAVFTVAGTLTDAVPPVYIRYFDGVTSTGYRDATTTSGLHDSTLTGSTVDSTTTGSHHDGALAAVGRREGVGP